MPGEQKKFIDKVYLTSGLSTTELATLAKVHPRSFLDWKREKLRMTLTAAEIFCEKFSIPLPETKYILVQRWKNAQKESNRSGGIARFKKYKFFATEEGRRKGGRNSWIKRKENPIIWRKYKNFITTPQESPDLAEIIGIILGDGGLTRFQCFIYLNSETDQQYAFYIEKLLMQLFNLHATIRKRKKEKLLRVSVSSIDMIEYLQQKGLCLGKKVHLQVKVPDWIWSNTEYIKRCIRGLIDTDGCFVIHKYTVN